MLVILTRLKAKSTKSLTSSIRTIITISKYSEIKVDEAVDEKAELGTFKNHIGKYTIRGIRVPDYLETSINDVLSDDKTQNLREECRLFRERLLHRNTILMKNIRKYKHVVEQFREKINAPENVEIIGKKNVEKLEKDVKFTLNEKDKHKIEYQHKESLLYLASRFGTDYAVLFQIFNEIKKRDPNYQPKSLFDFGSGVGTSMWAANTLWDSEPIVTFNFDISTYMNSTAQEVLKKCKVKKPFFKYATFKRNLPKSLKEEFDLVTCSFTLLDLPNNFSRLESVETLWNMLEKDGYLVLVETGNPTGFQVIEEIRDFIITKITQPIKDDSTEVGHIFSPCPHHMECPLAKEILVCKFKTSQNSLPIYDFLSMRKDTKKFPFSYLVLKKSPKPENFRAWPRFVLKDPVRIKNSVYNSWICRDDVSRVDNLVSTKSRDK